MGFCNEGWVSDLLDACLTTDRHQLLQVSRARGSPARIQRRGREGERGGDGERKCRYRAQDAHFDGHAQDTDPS